MLLSMVLSTAGVKALSFKIEKQGGEGIFCFSLLFLCLAGINPGALLLRADFVEWHQILRMAYLAISTMQIKSRGSAHEISG